MIEFAVGDELFHILFDFGCEGEGLQNGVFFPLLHGGN
jgi:hypothetical protein